VPVRIAAWRRFQYQEDKTMRWSLDLAGSKLPFRPFLNLRTDRRGIAGLLVIVALSAAASQTGCDKDHSSPTAPPPPPQAPLQQVVLRSTYVLLIVPNKQDRAYPRAAEVLVDDRSLWSGSVQEPTICCSSYSYSGDTPISYNVVASSEGTLAAGSHRLDFRVTDQARSPTGYTISGWVDVTWANFRDGNQVGSANGMRLATWQDVQVRLRTGQSWSLEFEMQFD
jgi:hypothetical protein